jgi:hypothetical protein
MALPRSPELLSCREVLVGCIDCNRWGHPGDDKLIMELTESALEALKWMRGENG